jgi:hypothetical protein
MRQMPGVWGQSPQDRADAELKNGRVFPAGPLAPSPESREEPEKVRSRGLVAFSVFAIILTAMSVA